MFERQGIHFFTFRDVKVAVSPWYIIIMLFWGFRSSPMEAGSGFQGEALASGIMWVVAITLSLLIHEFGHAFASKRWGLRPSILLHGFGGLCMHQPASTDGRDAFIVFAGPAVELVFGGLCLLLLWFGLPAMAGTLGPTGYRATSEFVTYLVYFNIVWGLVNLVLPIWPLDGGQLMHLLLRRFMDAGRAQELALKISIAALVPVGIVGLVVLHSFFIAILAVFLLINNINALKSARSLVARPGKAKASDFQSELIDEAEAALDAGDYQEAYRLCHQLRSTGEMPAKMLDRVWEILALSSVAMERFDEAESYLKRAPDTDAIRRARRHIEAQAG